MPTANPTIAGCVAYNTDRQVLQSSKSKGRMLCSMAADRVYVHYLLWLLLAALHFAGGPSQLILGRLLAWRELWCNLDVPPAQYHRYTLLSEETQYQSTRSKHWPNTDPI